MVDFFDELKKLQLSRDEFFKCKWQWIINKDEKAKRKLMNHFLPLALKVASSYHQKHGIFDLYDYFHEAYLSIERALEYYKYGKANLSTFVYQNMKWRLKTFVQENFSPVKYSLKQKKYMKEHGISMNPVYLSECDPEAFIDYETPLDILIKKSRNGKER